MKNYFLKNASLLIITLLLISCSENKELVEAAKAQLLNIRATPQTIEEYDFEVIELRDRDAYDMLAKKYQRGADGMDKFPEVRNQQLEMAKSYLQKQGEATENKMFYRVHAFRLVDKDTTDNFYIFLDDQNKYVDNIQP